MKNKTKVAYAIRGRFSLSKKACELLAKEGYEKIECFLDYFSKRKKQYFFDYTKDDGCSISRHDPGLIKVIEKLGGREAGGFSTVLEIVEINSDRYWIQDLTDRHDPRCINPFSGKVKREIEGLPLERIVTPNSDFIHWNMVSKIESNK